MDEQQNPIQNTGKNQPEPAQGGILRPSAFLDRKVRLKLFMYIAVLLALMVISIYELVIGNVNIRQLLIGWIIGTAFGLLVGGMNQVIWNQETEKVISKRDWKGILIMLIYIGVALKRNWILDHWFKGPALIAFIYCLLTGIRLGRIIYMRTAIRRILKAKGIISSRNSL